MPLHIFVNIGSGSNPNTLLKPRAFGAWNGGDYVVFNMDSGHMLLSTLLQKRSYAELKIFAQELRGEDYTERAESPHVMNWLFKKCSAKAVYAALSSTEKFAFQLDVRALRSALHLGPLTYHTPVKDAQQRQAWAAYELEQPNFEIALADQVQIPVGQCYAVISISPFDYQPINQSTVELLQPNSYFVLAGNFKRNDFCKNPAGAGKPSDFGLTLLGDLNEAWYQTLKANQKSVHTHSADQVAIEFQVYRFTG